MAPPTPCSARIPTSIGRDVLSAHPTDATVKTAMAEMKTRRVPNLSAIHPLAGIRTANTRRYEETATLTSTASTPKDWAIDGSAVARIVASSISMNSAAATSNASPRGNVTAPEPFGAIQISRDKSSHRRRPRQPSRPEPAPTRQHQRWSRPAALRPRSKRRNCEPR